MTVLLPMTYAVAGVALFVAIGYQVRLTGQVRGLFSRTPLIYSQLSLPEGVDVRAVLENPRLFYFSLAATGTVLRILLGIVVFLAIDVWAPGRPATVPALAVLVVLVAAEGAGRAFGPRSSRPIGRAAALVMSWIGVGVRLLPGARETDPAAPDDLGGDVVSTVDGQEMFDPVAKRFLGGFLNLKRTAVQRAMVSRDRVVTVGHDWTVAQAARAGTDKPFARIPVVGDDREIVGVVHTKDLLLLLHAGRASGPVESIMREVAYVRSSERLDSLLRRFQTTRTHLAVVRDAHGRTVGLITMDDILRVALSPEASV